MNETNQNSVLSELLATEESLRDQKWETQFLAELKNAHVDLLNEAPQTGPDNWPYLFVSINPNGRTPLKQIVRWLVERGIGLVINPQLSIPDYVLTYGMLWNFEATGEFISNHQSINNSSLILEPGKQIHSGSPEESYFPQNVRSMVKEFFSSNGVNDVKLIVLSDNRKDYHLCFSLESLGVPPEEEHSGILEAISWFFPSHYSLALISEEGLPPFHSL